MGHEHDFRGDLSRNEVELDLSKFLELLQDNYALRERVYTLETVESVNPWGKWIHLARAVNSWRLFPRIFISVYMWLVVYTAIWFMNIDVPTLEQAGLISVVIGAGAAWFGLYCSTGGDQNYAKILEAVNIRKDNE